jgi:hypothetical protein
VSKQEREFLDELRAKSVEAAADMMAGVQRLKTLHEDIAGEDAETDRVRLGDYLFKLAKLELEHAANILNLGNVQAEMMFDHVRRLVRRSQGAAGPRKVLEVLADPGKTEATAELLIRNPFDRDADPRFELGPFRRQDGTRGPVPGGAADEDAPGAPFKVKLDCDVVRPYSTATAKLTIHTGGAVEGVQFAELAVFLSAETEREVARRIVKLKPAPKEPPK